MQDATSKAPDRARIDLEYIGTLSLPFRATNTAWLGVRKQKAEMQKAGPHSQARPFEWQSVAPAYCGINTVSIAWIVPFEAATSVAITVEVPPAASVSTTAPSTSFALRVPPPTVVMV